MTYILGVNAHHADSSACIFKNGVMLAAIEEERLCRIKHWAGFPLESIRYCLMEAGISLSQVDCIAINQDASASLTRKFLYTLKNRPSFGMLVDKIKNKYKRLSIEKYLQQNFPDAPFTGEIHNVEHHLSHLASAFYVSPFEDAITLSVDGFGDFASAAWGIGKGVQIDVKAKVYFPHSLGIFYQALTQFIGFPNYGDEYKVMGLAPYGKGTYLPEMEKILLLEKDGSFKLNLKYFRHHKEKIETESTSGEPIVGTLYSKELSELLGSPRSVGEPLTQRHKDIAFSVQAMYEKAFFHLLNSLHSKYKINNLTIAGGCGMNSVANGKINLRTPFKKVYIQSASGDAGGAIGAALVVWHSMKTKLAKKRGPFHNHAYWGPSYSNGQIETVIGSYNEKILSEKCDVQFFSQQQGLFDFVAQSIADGLVVGWFQERMEWGPRALGNRSILGDPRRADMKDILNLKIKRRESFRPFAPSVLKEKVADWFEQNEDVPFMMQVYQVKSDKRSEIPAVVHADGSGRLQTVYAETNPRYYGLIESFYKLTGVPMLLNTSFNENEPVVCKPEEAIECFLRTKMDILVLGDWVIRRS